MYIKNISYQDYPTEPVFFNNLSVKFMRQALFIPLKLNNNNMHIAISNIEDFSTVEALKLAYGLNIEIFKGEKEDILDAIERLYGVGSQSIETIIEEADRGIAEESGEIIENVNHLRDLASEAPIIRLVNRLIVNAVEQKASDIHFEPFDNELKVRYRIDGILHDAEFPPKRLQAAIISRVKIMAKLDIAERRLPQDGRIKLKIGDKEIDFRVSTVPTLFGESVVMRILDRETLALDLEKLGFTKDMLLQYQKLISQPYGMVLVTGPTGSGKTSTLYTTLAKINSSEKKIITLEDPVEYQLKGVNQIQVTPKIGMTFAHGLRSIVRQDPDIILVGEIRDRETAEIAVQSALTGHLLFSTLHTNDAAGAITRLLDMGVENFLLSSTLLGVLAQRLVRVICKNCKSIDNPEQKLIESINVEKEIISKMQFYSGKGCESCRFTGFSGRTVIFEYLIVNEGIRKGIMGELSTDRIKEIACKNGMNSIRQCGWQKVFEGITTVAEVLKVTLEI